KRTDLGYQSTGIGLAFAKSIIDKHHGPITAESREGEGTTFTVIIPARREAYDNDANVVIEQPGSDGAAKDAEVPAAESVVSYLPVEPSASAGNEGDTDRERPLILIVEDNFKLRRNLINFFTPYFRIIEASDGEEGLDTARSSNPDLIISDVMMPRMSGTEMCRRIKSEFDLCHIPVILLTALSTSESKLEGFNANADDYVTKPFESTLLLARIDNLLRNRRILQSRITREPVSEIDMTPINPIDRDLLTRVTALIDSHIDDPELDIPFLCREVGISRTLFFNKFKALTGITPAAFILSHRLKAAAALLAAQPHLSIADVADMTGFTTAVYFSRCFKKQYGVSPQHYR
ncbi:MAG: response regulator, partial [Candidatus Amulumruptor sp.]|nr:response regulator [Candidatus Amulumruptor sp.]